MKKDKIKILFCSCGWKSEPNIGMKNECPECKKPLLYIKGTKKEIKEYFN